MIKPRQYTALVILLFLSSCITLKEPEVRGIENFNAAGLLSSKPKISFDVMVFNPNNIGVSLTDFKLNVLYGSRSMADLEVEKEYYAAPLSETAIPVVIQPTMQQLNLWMEIGLAGLSQAGSNKLNGKGSLRLKKYVFSKNFYFTF